MATNKLTTEFPLLFFNRSEKKRSDWKIGTEQEFFGFDKKYRQRLSYQNGIKKILESFVHEFQWEPIFEEANIIAAHRGNNRITLEPGGQIELSAKPHSDLCSIQKEYEAFREQLTEISRHYGFFWLSIGYDPFSKLAAIPWMPKKRYQIMGDYLPQFGDRVHHMMLATCSVQANYDYESENDMRKKMLVTMAFSPVVSALFATSAFRENKAGKIKRLRSWAWMGVDPARSGFLDFVFQSDFGYQRYIDYIKKTPMLLIIRDNRVIDTRGIDFDQFMKKGFQGIEPREEDWINHLGAVFPVSRLKNVIETRTGDAGPESMILTQTAFWKGLLYDKVNLEKAVSMASEIGLANLKQLYEASIVDGLEAAIPLLSLFELCKEMIALSEQGLDRLAKKGIPDEKAFLDPVKEIIKLKRNLSEQMQQLYQKQGGDLYEILDQYKLIIQ